jgi:hypothetical protein
MLLRLAGILRNINTALQDKADDKKTQKMFDEGG